MIRSTFRRPSSSSSKDTPTPDPPAIYQVTLPDSTFGIGVQGGEIVLAPPIARWMLGFSYPFIRRWIINKGGSLRLQPTLHLPPL
jgi:hypothetical protein